MSARPLPTFALTACAALTLSALATGCAGFQMIVPEPARSAPALTIEGGGKTRTVGATTITKTKGGGITTFSGSAGPWGGEKIKQNFEYETSDGWAGSCAFATGAQSLGGFEIASSGGLKCTINKGEETWTLDLLALDDGGKRLIGTYANGSSTIDVKLSRESTSLPMFMGYNLSVGGAAVAAVQVTGTKQYWLVEGADDAEAITASLGAFLFSQPAVQQAVQ